MPSFELAYDGDEDVLEITFAVFDERFARTVLLNDLILVHADLGLTQLWGLTLYEYAGLLEASETELVGLEELSPLQTTQLYELLKQTPGNSFLHVTDEELRLARVLSPTLSQLMTAAP